MVAGSNSDVFFDDGEFDELLDENSLSQIDSLTNFESSGESSWYWSIYSWLYVMYVFLTYPMYIGILESSSLSSAETSGANVDSFSMNELPSEIEGVQNTYCVYKFCWLYSDYCL